MKEHLTLLAKKVGHLPNLNTAAKNEIIAAINELVAVKALLNGDSLTNFTTKNLVVAGQISSAIFDNGTSGVIDWNKGNTQKVTLNATNNPISFTFTNDIIGAYYTLILDVTIPAFIVTSWPASVLWPADVNYLKNNLFQGVFVVNLVKTGASQLIANIGGPFI